MFVINSECRQGMKDLIADNSIDAIVCDPPYGLSKQPDMSEVLKHWLAGDDYTHGGSGFMGKSWDSFVPGPSVWREAFRCLKPGGYALVFAGARTQDLMTTSLRLAGFEIRDSIMWIYGSGFPKSLDVSKAVDKADKIGASRERALKFTTWLRSTGITGTRLNTLTSSDMGSHYLSNKSQPSIPTLDMFELFRAEVPEPPAEIMELMAWRTVESENMKRREVIGQRVNGIGTGGGHTPIMKDLENKDITAAHTEEAQLWEGYGTAIKPAYEPIIVCRKPLEGTVADNVLKYGTGAINIEGCRVGGEGGRWPANIMHDGSDDVLDAFPDAAGARGNVNPTGKPRPSPGAFNDMAAPNGQEKRIEDSKSAARFFYCAKASTADREAGLELFEAMKQQDESRNEGDPGGNNPRNRGARERKNYHPTVKPTELMRWLCRLVGHPGAMIMDPFTGSGSTGRGALLEGFNFIGFEDDAEICKIADARIINTLC